jgi:hypothetical protein
MCLRDQFRRLALANVFVLSYFKQVVKEGDLQLHSVIARLVDKETLESMGAEQAQKGQLIWFMR